MKIIFLSLLAFLMHISGAHAASESFLSSCKQGAKIHAEYSMLVDSLYKKALMSTSAESQEFKKFREEMSFNHAKFKSSSADELYQIAERLIKAGRDDQYSADTWRWILEGTIDIAYVVASESMLTKSLGKSKDNYERLIYDRCVGMSRK